MEEALMELVRTGVPLAATAIKFYYLYWAAVAVSTSACILIPCGLGYHLIKRGQDFEMSLRIKKGY